MDSGSVKEVHCLSLKPENVMLPDAGGNLLKPKAHHRGHRGLQEGGQSKLEVRPYSFAAPLPFSIVPFSLFT
jgi:hypothetical protein